MSTLPDSSRMPRLSAAAFADALFGEPLEVILAVREQIRQHLEPDPLQVDVHAPGRVEVPVVQIRQRIGLLALVPGQPVRPEEEAALAHLVRGLHEDHPQRVPRRQHLVEQEAVPAVVCAAREGEGAG